MSCLFFRNCLYFYQTYFQFLKILRGFSHPLVGRGAGAAHRSGRDRLSTPVFCGEPRDQHRGHLRAFGPTCNLKLSSCSLGGWRGPFTLKSLLQHSLLSSSLLFLLNLPGIWGRVIRCEGPGCSREPRPPCADLDRLGRLYKGGPAERARLQSQRLAVCTEHRGASLSRSAMLGRLT